MKPLWCIEKNNMYAKAHDDAVKAFAKKNRHALYAGF
jgi:hypothetical protein